MWYEFTNWLNEVFGWIIGTRYHAIQQYDLKKPTKSPDETTADYAKRLIKFKLRFYKNYTYRSYLKRSLLVSATFLLLTNPGRSEFLSFEKSKIHYPDIRCGREYNFFFFSIYKAGTKRYFGLIGNFWENKPANVVENNISDQAVDTIKTPSDTAFRDPLGLENQSQLNR
ncbi:hypothetical protein ACFFGT_09490 [Mucilaginibacter angelicae]|uniref:Uncharacterized protein n=1 Tax=Mucilaginibacter angelicae TaxID=869718 RepID=A0ABV6L4N0_9SPHI